MQPPFLCAPAECEPFLPHFDCYRYVNNAAPIIGPSRQVCLNFRNIPPNRNLREIAEHRAKPLVYMVCCAVKLRRNSLTVPQSCLKF